MGAINFAGFSRLLDYQVTSVIRHSTIFRIMSDYAGKTDHTRLLTRMINFKIRNYYSFFFCYSQPIKYFGCLKIIFRNCFYCRAIILCRITKVKNNVLPSLGNQILCQITEYRGVRLQRLFSMQKCWKMTLWSD